MKGGSVSVVCKGYITKVVWRAILALSGAWGPRELVISDMMVSMACAVAGVRRRRLLAASSYPMSVSMDTFCCLCAAAWLRGLNGLIERSRRRPGMHGNLVLSSTAVHVHVHCMLDSRSAQQSESIIR